MVDVATGWGGCQGPYGRYKPPIPLNEAHINHVNRGKRRTDKCSSLRTQCQQCRVRRRDARLRCLIAAALHDDPPPPDYREFYGTKTPDRDFGLAICLRDSVA